MANGKERASAILLKLSAAIASPSPQGDGGSRWPRGGKTEYKVCMASGDSHKEWRGHEVSRKKDNAEVAS